MLVVLLTRGLSRLEVIAGRPVTVPELMACISAGDGAVADRLGGHDGLTVYRIGRV